MLNPFEQQKTFGHWLLKHIPLNTFYQGPEDRLSPVVEKQQQLLGNLSSAQLTYRQALAALLETEEMPDYLSRLDVQGFFFWVLRMQHLSNWPWPNLAAQIHYLRRRMDQNALERQLWIAYLQAYGTETAVESPSAEATINSLIGEIFRPKPLKTIPIFTTADLVLLKAIDGQYTLQEQFEADYDRWGQQLLVADLEDEALVRELFEDFLLFLYYQTNV